MPMIPYPPDSIMSTYNRSPLTFTQGKAAWLHATNNEHYLDFISGVAVNTLGYSHPILMNVLKQQIDKIWHISNLYTIPSQQILADKLTKLTFADQVFFCNSGAEAVEAAIKTARKHHAMQGDRERSEIISFQGGFHGRTLATIAAAGNSTHLDGFGIPAPDFLHLTEFSTDMLQQTINAQTAAILIEPIQGEGGIVPIPHDFLQFIRKICHETGILLIFDEVQSGIGRTGKLFAHEWYDVTPDIMAIAKGLGGGFPVGATLATHHAAQGMVAGSHGSTFGGNPLSMAMATTVLEIVSEPNFLVQVNKNALILENKLKHLIEENTHIFSGMRGKGFMLGLECIMPNTEIVEALRKKNLLTVTGGNNVVRLLPPLIINVEDIDFAINALFSACQDLS